MGDAAMSARCVAASALAPGGRTGGWRRAQARAGRALAAPAAALLLGLVLGPSSLAVVLSLTGYQLGADTIAFIGLGNYAEMVADPLFWKSLTNTLIYVGSVVPLSVLLGLAAALLIESRGLLRGVYRAAYFLPVTATLVAMATVFEFMLLPHVGLVNQLAAILGWPGHAYLSDADTALFAIAAIGVWELVGFNMVLFIAGLTAIPRDLYASAAIDGATGWDRFLCVTWPMLGPTTMFVVIITAIRGFRVFDTVVVLTEGGPNGATEVLLYTIYTEAFRYFRIGYASALTVVFLAFVSILTLLQARLFDRRVHYT